MKACVSRNRKGKDKGRQGKKNHLCQTFSTTTADEYFMQKSANDLEMDGIKAS